MADSAAQERLESAFGRENRNSLDIGALVGIHLVDDEGYYGPGVEAEDVEDHAGVSSCTPDEDLALRPLPGGVLRGQGRSPIARIRSPIRPAAPASRPP